jgi:hypothetical protein
MNELKTGSLHLIPSISMGERKIRWKKVFKIRHRLRRGKYDINKRLDVVLDRIHEDLLRRR